MSRAGALWGAGTLLAAALAAPLDWRAAVLCVLGALGTGSPRWAAVCAAPLWVTAVLSGHPLAVLLLLWACAHLHRSVLGPLILLAALIEGARAWLLAPVLPASTVAMAPLWLAGLVLAGLASGTPGGRMPAAGLLLAGIGLGAGAFAAAGDARTSAADISRAARWGVLEAGARPPTTALQLWAVREAPRWHSNAQALPVELALSMGWWPEGSPLEPGDRVRAARWLDAHERGGLARRLLQAVPDGQVRWWEQYYRAADGLTLSDWDVDWPVPDEALRLSQQPVEALLFSSNRTQTLLLHLDEPATGVDIIASADWFQGPPQLELMLDGELFRLQPTRSPRRYQLQRPLGVGPHQLLIRYGDDLFTEHGDRNVYVHAVLSRS